jgi:glutamine amidotransferase
MCRLYGFCATEDTKVECTLVHSQNALMAQSESDTEGKSHAHGWGVVTYKEGTPQIVRQAWAAYHGEHFRKAAASVYSDMVIAHVRRATVGAPRLENTHPFTHGKWAFAHNGTIPEFPRIQDDLRQLIAPQYLPEISGETDSEHLFYYLMTLIDQAHDRPVEKAVAQALSDIKKMLKEYDITQKAGLNVLLCDGKTIYGSRSGRSLFYTNRNGIHDCEICGFPHIHHDIDNRYHALVVASEPLTHEVWREVPEHSVWRISDDRRSLEISHPAMQS